jgi:hypothetical protein
MNGEERVRGTFEAQPKQLSKEPEERDKQTQALIEEKKTQALIKEKDKRIQSLTLEQSNEIESLKGQLQVVQAEKELAETRYRLSDEKLSRSEELWNSKLTSLKASYLDDSAQLELIGLVEALVQLQYPTRKFSGGVILKDLLRELKKIDLRPPDMT